LSAATAAAARQGCSAFSRCWGFPNLPHSTPGACLSVHPCCFSHAAGAQHGAQQHTHTHTHTSGTKKTQPLQPLFPPQLVLQRWWGQQHDSSPKKRGPPRVLPAARRATICTAMGPAQIAHARASHSGMGPRAPKGPSTAQRAEPSTSPAPHLTPAQSGAGALGCAPRGVGA
jgi:hypothetical protein